MDDASVSHSIARIEAALARIEDAVQDTADLRRRHEGLKASVTASIEHLDDLLARRDR